jgi:ornithine decarboxylase
VIDGRLIQERFRELQKAIGNARIYYAVKTNPHWRIIELLHELGAHFEISSAEELKLLLRRGVPAERIIASNPVKTEASLRAAWKAGVQFFAFDSYAEVEKLSRFAPGSKVYVRLVVSNEGSQWPLTRKFGVETEDAVELLCEAQRKGLDPCGVTFHVGSQCTSSETWVKAIEKARVVWELAEDRGIRLRMLNVGGGFPIKYNEDSISITEAAARVRDTINGLFPEDVEVLVEPGRSIVGEAGTLVSTVVGKASRNGENWLYLDVGVFNGLMESIGGIRYPMTSTKNGNRERYVLAGPSCDSLDIIQDDTLLPDLDVGDRVYILSAGAYTTAYASQFDGLTIPKTTVV